MIETASNVESRFVRWLNADPAGLAGGLNLYAYVGNNPISRIDPLGLYVWQAQYWADQTVNGSWYGKAAGWVLGPMAMLVPSGGGSTATFSYSGPTHLGAQAGVNGQYFWADKPQSDFFVFGGPAVSSSNTANANVSLEGNLAWSGAAPSDLGSNSWTGTFTNYSLTVGSYSLTFSTSSLWDVVNVGLAAKPGLSFTVSETYYLSAELDSPFKKDRCP